MIWTKEQRYRRIEEVSDEERHSLKERVNDCLWRQTFHIQPETGLLNDPNGFSYYNGEYHLFYQWFPLGPVHGLKYWYHTKSTDLVHWENVGIGIKPTNDYDSHGAYSGSAIEHEGKLYLLYTGNTRDENWVRRPYQCIAIMDESGEISKLEHPVIDKVPDGYTDHFRDPKVFKKDEMFYTVIGAQRKNGTGCVVVYSSPDLFHWQCEGEIQTDLKDFGYMWECPDYFEVEDRGILLFSPQGLNAKGDHYENIFQAGYILGDKLDIKQMFMSHGSFHELDRGFDFYAPQTTVDSEGRRIVVGWMGLPEINYPTDKNGWAHCLTLPRELLVRGDKLIQRPIKELQVLRKREYKIKDSICSEQKMYEGFTGIAYEMICEFENENATEYGIVLRASENEGTIIKYDAVQKKVILDRTHSGKPVGEEYGTTRKHSIEAQTIKFHVFVDVSSVEIFINDGEEVFTSRIFPRADSNEIRFFANKGSVMYQATRWDYE
ncbi:sucrose-6-phosphate hydrolase [Bacillus sp. Xin]|uniref:glycoside hydrolase family 32 protein n=1 Tax=unclassified Bacillus (in: firmicutes) TaxID=185979 RepID=UPI001571D8ED|nr:MULTISPECIES: sucrose-6-phosphate hydrolase [unclassified Bacillus (in: firmicutes)]MBC6976085.1 sucrose-6-phosphate hydrolase [Bacillus sp. Xin]NSW37267.1 sucrose-6-phosphate hydrolase [Bacillus sp. Xin1]